MHIEPLRGLTRSIGEVRDAASFHGKIDTAVDWRWRWTLDLDGTSVVSIPVAFSLEIPASHDVAY